MALQKTLTPIASLKAEASLTTPLATLTTAFAVITALVATNAAALDPAGEVVSLRATLEATTDPTTRQNIGKQIAAYSSHDPRVLESSQISARATVLAAYPAVRTASLAVLTQAITLVNGYITTATADETAPYTTYSMTYVPWSITARYAALKAQLLALQASETASINAFSVNQWMSPFYTHPVISFLS